MSSLAPQSVADAAGVSPGALRSRLYRGTVWHRRTEPAYTFRYSVWYLGLDLDELDAVEARLRLFSRNRLNLTSLRDADYLVLQRGLDAYTTSAEAPLRSELLTMPRFLGYAFNPVSFVLQRDAAGRTANVLAEVHNTWGERHVYTLERHDGVGPDETYVSGADKAFYVSPFIDAAGSYRFELHEAADGRLRIRIDESDGEREAFFQAGIDLRPLALTDANLAGLLLRFPFVNLKTIAAIHWQGLRLWLRGEPFRRNPSRVAATNRPEVPGR